VSQSVRKSQVWCSKTIVTLGIYSVLILSSTLVKIARNIMVALSSNLLKTITLYRSSAMNYIISFFCSFSTVNIFFFPDSSFYPDPSSSSSSPEEVGRVTVVLCIYVCKYSFIFCNNVKVSKLFLDVQ
jgi:hypothetical protein